MNKEEIERVKKLLNKCDKCKLKECIACEFTWTDIQKIKEYVKELEFQNTALKAEHNHNITRIKELEQKESILDKVTEFLKEEPTTENVGVEASKIYRTIYKTQIDKTKMHALEFVNSYRKEILNIIEGEKK